MGVTSGVGGWPAGRPQPSRLTTHAGDDVITSRSGGGLDEGFALCLRASGTHQGGDPVPQVRNFVEVLVLGGVLGQFTQVIGDRFGPPCFSGHLLTPRTLERWECCHGCIPGPLGIARNGPVLYFIVASWCNVFYCFIATYASGFPLALTFSFNCKENRYNGGRSERGRERGGDHGGASRLWDRLETV